MIEMAFQFVFFFGMATVKDFSTRGEPRYRSSSENRFGTASRESHLCFFFVRSPHKQRRRRAQTQPPFGAQCVGYHSPTKKNSQTLFLETALVLGWREFGIKYSNRNSNNSVHVAPGGAENTRWDTCRRQLCLRRNYRQFFGWWFSEVNGMSAQMWRRRRNTHVLLHVRAYGDSPVSLAMTHMRWVHGQGGHKSTGYTQSVVHCVGGLRAWPIDSCSNKDAGRSECETPTPCAGEQAGWYQKNF